MLFALDGLPLSQTLTGVGRYALELARHLASIEPEIDFQIVSPRPFLPQLNALAQNSDEFAPRNLRFVYARTNALTRRWFAAGLPAYLARTRVALFHGVNYEVPLLALRRCPTVLTVHDLSLLTHPTTHEPARVRRAKSRLPLMIRRASRVITPTEYVRAKVCERFKLAPERVVAAPEAARKLFRPMDADEARAVCERLGVGASFVLFVGTIEPRKNLSTLVRAFERIAHEAEAKLNARATEKQSKPADEKSSTPDGEKLQLVIAGAKGWLTDELYAQIESSPVKDRLRFVGYVSDETLRALYSSCLAFVFPSLEEGFGLPPLEAMACGAPVVASRIPAHTETLAEAARFFSPADTDALAQTLLEVIANENERQRLAAKGLARAAQFSWERTARRTLEVYRELLS